MNEGEWQPTMTVSSIPAQSAKASIISDSRSLFNFLIFPYPPLLGVFSQYPD